MRRMSNHDTGCGRTAVMAGRIRVRASAAYLSSRWVQAPIPVRREADT